MIEFHCNKRDKYKTPILYNTEIWNLAESQVGDYKPALLREPSAINAVHFAESYLGANIDYQDIYYDKGSLPIAGATVFNDDIVKVFDHKLMCTKIINVRANTILIDNSTMEKGKEGFATFTVLHEGGHFCIHPEVFRRDTEQLSAVDCQEKDGSHVVCCRKINIEKTFNSVPDWTPEMRREHHANVYAAFTAMPRQTFIPCAKEYIRRAGFKDGIYVLRTIWDAEYDEPLQHIVGNLSGIYKVSHTAVSIHLKTLCLLMTKSEYMKEHSKIAVAF